MKNWHHDIFTLPSRIIFLKKMYETDRPSPWRSATHESLALSSQHLDSIQLLLEREPPLLTRRPPSGESGLDLESEPSLFVHVQGDSLGHSADLLMASEGRLLEWDEEEEEELTAEAEDKVEITQVVCALCSSYSAIVCSTTAHYSLPFHANRADSIANFLACLSANRSAECIACSGENPFLVFDKFLLPLL